tara:strand:- start:578 stop:1204 length:627 start_codon:yes stop_codon:yes gene_type:complete
MIQNKIQQIKSEIGNRKLIIVSKKRSLDEIMSAYNTGHRDFGENRVQELIEKYHNLPKDIRWHMIGHLQKNKVKYIIPFIHLIHSVDSLGLLEWINKISNKENKRTNCLIQVKIAEEDTKFGFSKSLTEKFIVSNYKSNYPFINIKGLMGMATATDKKEKIEQEFQKLKYISMKNPELNTLCMGMSQDYKIAIKNESNMIRVGTYIFS